MLREGAGADPDCAMAHWGIAYAAGPNYNLPWELLDPPARPPRSPPPMTPRRRRWRVADRVTAVERALIEALPARYPQRDADRGPAAAGTRPSPTPCAACSRASRTTSTSRCVFVEAIMNETPWQMWDLAPARPPRAPARSRRAELLDTAFRRPARRVGPSRPAAPATST